MFWLEQERGTLNELMCKVVNLESIDKSLTKTSPTSVSSNENEGSGGDEPMELGEINRTEEEQNHNE